VIQPIIIIQEPLNAKEKEEEKEKKFKELEKEIEDGKINTALGLDTGVVFPLAFSKIKIQKGISPKDDLKPEEQFKISKKMMNGECGMIEYRRNLNQKKKSSLIFKNTLNKLNIKMDGVSSINQLENNIVSPKNYKDNVSHLKVYFNSYIILRHFYSRKEFSLQKNINRRTKRRIYIKLIKEKIPLDSILFIGSSYISSPVIKIGGSLGSAAQFFKILKEMKRKYLFIPEHYSTRQCCRCFQLKVKAIKGINNHLQKLIYHDSKPDLDCNISKHKRLEKHLFNIMKPETEEKFKKDHPKSFSIINTRLFNCFGCNLFINRDYNAAQKILYNGLCYIYEMFMSINSTRLQK